MASRSESARKEVEESPPIIIKEFLRELLKISKGLVKESENGQRFKRSHSLS